MPLADFLLGSVFEFRQSTPFTLDIKQKYFGLYAQDTWRLSPKVTMNYGVRWEPWFPQQHQQSQIYNFDIDRFNAGQRSTVFPQAPPGLRYPGDEGFPTQGGHVHRVAEHPAARRRVVGSRTATAGRRCAPATA